MGCLAGIIVSFLTGSVFFAMIKTSIEKGFKAGSSMALGVFFSDSIYCGLVYFGLNTLIDKYKFYLGIFGGSFLFILGIIYLFNKSELKPGNIDVNRFGYIAKGFVMNFLNPSVPILWITIITIITSWNYTSTEKGLFFIVALFTMITVDLFKTYYVAKLRDYITPNNINWLNRIAGFALLLLGLRMGLKAYFG